WYFTGYRAVAISPRLAAAGAARSRCVRTQLRGQRGDSDRRNLASRADLKGQSRGYVASDRCEHTLKRRNLRSIDPGDGDGIATWQGAVELPSVRGDLGELERKPPLGSGSKSIVVGQIQDAQRVAGLCAASNFSIQEPQ